MKKILFSVFLMLFLMAGSVLAVDDCTVSTANDTFTFTDMTIGDYNSLAKTGEDQKVVSTSSFITFTPSQNSTLVDRCENYTITNGTTTSLNWSEIDAGTLSVANSTNSAEVMGTLNYTVSNKLGQVTWAFNGSTNWTDVQVQICYNKSLVISTTNLANLTLYSGKWGMENADTYGSDPGIALLYADLNNTNWTGSYTYTARSCPTRDGCRATQAVIYTGFGLIALFVIGLAAFAIISLTSGNMDAGTLTVITILGIGIAVAVMVGVIIIGKVGQAVCVV